MAIEVPLTAASSAAAPSSSPEQLPSERTLEEALISSPSNGVVDYGGGQGSPMHVRYGSFSEQISYWGESLLSNRIRLLLAIASWYGVGVIAIVTTKILLTEWQVPPLLLTFQQLLLASTLLRIRLALSSSGAQPWPWNVKENDSSSSVDFVLAGLFNAMDFLASNTAFSLSAASFVETIKSTDPISTTAVALVWKVDRLGTEEGICLVFLIVGMLLSTWGNSEGQEDSTALTDSIRTATIVITANFCFAFRCMTQKLYRHSASEQMNDENLQCRMQQVGWMALSLPAVLYYRTLMWDAFFDPSVEENLQYLKISAANAICYCIYNFAGTYVLSKLTVLHHSTLGCLRRLLCIVATSLFFGVPMTFVGAIGVFASFLGFCGFTHYRNQRKRKDKASV